MPSGTFSSTRGSVGNLMKREYTTPELRSFDSSEIVRLIGPALGYGGMSGGAGSPLEVMGGGVGQSGDPGHYGR